MSVFTSKHPDEDGIILGTGMWRFVAGRYQIHGLMKIEGDGKSISLLSVVSDEEGRGNFRRFICDLKDEFEEIRIDHILNPEMENILARYGFTATQRYERHPATEFFGPQIELVTGMIWCRK